MKTTEKANPIEKRHVSWLKFECVILGEVLPFPSFLRMQKHSRIDFAKRILEDVGMSAISE